MRDSYCVLREGKCEEPLCGLCRYRQEATPEEKDAVVTPRHYSRFKIEPITFICENKLDFFQGNIVKYTCRHDAKNGLEDIKKAIRYGQMYEKFLRGDPNWSK